MSAWTSWDTTNEQFLISLLVPRCSFKEGKIVKGFVVLDLQGIGMKQMGKETMKTIKKILSADSDNYPDSLKKLFIINAPGFFTFIWRVIRPWLHPVVLAKIEMTQKGNVLSALEETGAAECCKSAAYGGTATPIKGITNAQCFLPFGGYRRAPPNKVDEWGADALIEICTKADKMLASENEGNGADDIGIRVKSGKVGGIQRSSVANLNPRKEYSVMKKRDEEDLAEILRLLIMIVGISFLAVVTGFVQRTLPDIFGNW